MPYKSEELDAEPFSKRAQQVAVDVFNGISGAAEDALEGFTREGARAFARLIQARLFDRERAIGALTERAKGAGLHVSGDIRREVTTYLKALEEGSADPPLGQFESKAHLVVDAYGDAETEAEVTVARVRRVWSELPLIVLAGLR